VNEILLGDNMQTIKVMSIIGIVVFAISIICIIGFMPVEPNDYYDIASVDAALGWGIISTLWGIAYAITCLVQSTKK
tara:strand:+ start:197 stop:427 length:231 start_codon:yes stop_codon:yes gene_type:complete